MAEWRHYGGLRLISKTATSTGYLASQCNIKDDYIYQAKNARYVPFFFFFHDRL